jgi:transcriptional regulator with XRE-family HTH domain
MDTNSDHPLRQLRERLNLSIDDLAEVTGVSARTILRAEQGHVLQPGSRRLLSSYLGMPADDLGLRPRSSGKQAHDGQMAAPLLREKEIIFAGSTGIQGSIADAFLFDVGVTDKLDNAESIINLAWEAWFASCPSVVSRSVNKLLPNLEKIAYTPYLPLSQTLRAKELVIRAHGLLGSVCLDALHNDTALFHYMQAHRFAEEIHDSDHTTTYLCLVGEVLRRQKDEAGALAHMENARSQASGASKTTRGHILQLLAYAYGDTGQEVAFERAISEATDLLAFSGEGRDISQKEFIPFEVYEIRGKINRDLGRPMDAIPYLDLAEASLIIGNSVAPRWQALLEISRAQVYCDAGDFATGIDLACKGFLKAYQCRSFYQMNRIRKLLRKLEQRLSRNHQGVQDLKNLLYETYMLVDNEDVG